MRHRRHLVAPLAGIEETMTREFGTVLSWNDQEGHGRIQSDNGDELWAHFSFIRREGYRALRVGQRVEYLRVDMGFGPPEEQLQARDITELGL